MPRPKKKVRTLDPNAQMPSWQTHLLKSKMKMGFWFDGKRVRLDRRLIEGTEKDRVEKKTKLKNKKPGIREEVEKGLKRRDSIIEDLKEIEKIKPEKNETGIRIEFRKNYLKKILGDLENILQIPEKYKYIKMNEES